MIVIYNLGGLLVGGLGLLAGLGVAMASGYLFAGVLVAGVIWLIFGRARVDRETGVKGRAPAVFFVPLWIWSIVLLAVAVPGMGVEYAVKRTAADRPVDPRRAELRQAGDRLRAQLLSGNQPLSEQIRSALMDLAVAEAKAEGIHVHTQIEGQRVLILLQMEALKNFEDSARAELLDLITVLLAEQEIYRDLEPYIGVKGRAAWGAIQTPAGRKTGAVVSSEPLLDYFGERPATTQPAEAAGP